MQQATVHVALYDNWADWEVGHLMARVQNPLWQRQAGAFRIQTVSDSLEPVRSMGGLTVIPDLTAGQVSPGDSAMLVLPGSSSWEDPGIPWATHLALRFSDAGVPLAAICGATLGLARAGLLDDRRHTSAVREYLAMSGYRGGEFYADEDAVTDRGVVTAGPVDELPFARAALDLLGVFEPDVLDAWYRLSTDHDVQAYGVLARTAARQAPERPTADQQADQQADLQSTSS